MNKKIILIIGVILMLICGYFTLKFINDNLNPANKIETSYGVSISKQELQTEINRLNTFYAYSRQTEINQAQVEKDALERLTEDKIVEKYASMNNISVSENEPLDKYNQLVKINTEKVLLDKLKQMYGISKNDYLLVLEKDILREKVQKAVDKPLAKWLLEEKNKVNVSKK